MTSGVLLDVLMLDGATQCAKMNKSHMLLSFIQHRRLQFIQQNICKKSGQNSQHVQEEEDDKFLQPVSMKTCQPEQVD